MLSFEIMMQHADFLQSRLVIKACSTAHPDAVLLIAALSKTLLGIVGDPGTNSFATWRDGDPDHLFVIAYEDDKPVGCGGLRLREDGLAEIKRVFAAQPGAGIGSAIMDHLESAAWARGYPAVVLETRAVNARALAFYAARGFARIAPYGHYAARPDAVCLEKRAPQNPA